METVKKIIVPQEDDKIQKIKTKTYSFEEFEWTD